MNGYPHIDVVGLFNEVVSAHPNAILLDKYGSILEGEEFSQMIRRRESQRDFIAQPGVGAQHPPRVIVPQKIPNPKGVASPAPAAVATPSNPFRGDGIIGRLPGVADCIGNAGPNDFYPVGIHFGLIAVKFVRLPLNQTNGVEMKKELSPKQREELLRALKARFEKNLNRHKSLDWAKVQARLDANAEKLWSLHEMERTGGEPDVVGHDRETGEYIFIDCSPETPKGRTSDCYDRQGLESRKEHKPKNTAMDMAAAMGIELLTEEEYFALQKLGEFDTKTSSWVKTPPEIRNLGGALYGDRRYGRVFVGHNGAQSYYAARGFRGWLKV